MFNLLSQGVAKELFDADIILQSYFPYECRKMLRRDHIHKDLRASIPTIPIYVLLGSNLCFEGFRYLSSQ